MESLLAQLSLTNVELAICEEEAQLQSQQFRSLQAANLQLASQLLLASKPPVLSLGKDLSPRHSKSGRDSLDTQDGSPRFTLMTEGTEIDPKRYSKCRHILAKWDKFKGSGKLRRALRLGFPKQLRGELWERSIGNGLRLQPQSLATFLEQAKEPTSREDCCAVNLIPLDVRRTLTYLQTFQEDQPLHQPLKQLLHAFTGMAYLAAVFLLHLHPPQAFVCFANILVESQILYDFFTFNVSSINAYYQALQATMRRSLPKVSEQLQALSITPEMYVLEWIYTLFVRCVRMEEIGQVWDYVFTEGVLAFVKVPVAVLGRMQAAILQANLDSICDVFDHVPKLVGSAKELLEACQQVSLADEALGLV